MGFNNKLYLDIETTGLDPWFGSKITCICAKAEFTNNNEQKFEIFQESLRDKDEGMLIRYFFNWLANKTDCMFVFHNGVKFDIPFILTRATINGFSMDKFDFIFKMSFFDTMTIIKKWLSLNDLAKLYRVEGKNGTGENAIALYQAGKFDELENYCMQDVNVTKNVYEKYLKISGKELL